MYSRKTIFLDIDGTILSHTTSEHYLEKSESQKILSNVLEKMNEWKEKKYVIVLTTARNEQERAHTEWQMKHFKIPHDHLLMDLPLGERVVINDSKPYKEWENKPTAIGITVKRDQGLGNVDI